jgi:hypothetical protein
MSSYLYHYEIITKIEEQNYESFVITSTIAESLKKTNDAYIYYEMTEKYEFFFASNFMLILLYSYINPC